jgi:hypothetical protein
VRNFVIDRALAGHKPGMDIDAARDRNKEKAQQEDERGTGARLA